MSNDNVQLIECPRDAMQGWKSLIPTEQKVQYINSLLKIGFHTIDFGSFVSPKAIPQMADTREVLAQLEMDDTSSKLLAIVANTRGATEASTYEQISYLGYPFSVSPTFQLKNTNSTIEKSISTVDEIQNICLQHQKTLVVYLSMGFGNPYGDEYSEEILMKWAATLVDKGITVISLADTVGLATPGQIAVALKNLIPAYPDVLFGVHLHSSPFNWKEKVEAAFLAGCKRFDGALRGIGGCPMANDELVGNMNMENMIAYFEQQQKAGGIDHNALAESLHLAENIFTN